MADETPLSSGGGAPPRNPLVTILLLTNMIGLGVIAYFQMRMHEREANRPTVKDIVDAQMKQYNLLPDEEKSGEDLYQQDEGFLMPLEGFTANLAQGDGPRRFVRVNMVLKFNEDSKKDEFKARKPQIRDTIISILNSKRPEDLLKVEGKKFLKEEVKAAINSYLIDGHVKDIYYVSFQIN